MNEITSRTLDPRDRELEQRKPPAARYERASTPA
jgi:hypothetical protein